MAKKSLNLQFPMGGIDQRMSYRNQPPYTCPDAQNVRGEDMLEERARGGQRRGLLRAYYEQLGSGAPIKGMHQVSTVDDTPVFFDIDTFDRTTLGAGWAAASWVGAAPYITTEIGSATSTGIQTGMVRDAIGLDTSSNYDIELFIEPSDGEHRGTYHIYARMDDTTPDVSSGGIDCALTLEGSTSAYSGQITVDGSTTYSFSTGNNAAPVPGIFRVNVNGDVVTCYWRGAQLVSQTVAAATGTRVGMGIDATDINDTALVSLWRVTGSPSTELRKEGRRTRLCAISNGTLYVEKEVGHMSSVATLSLDSNERIMMAERGQKLYIANYHADVDNPLDMYVYDPKTDTYTTWTASEGTIPTNCDILCRWRDRAVLCDGSTWYMSRVGDWTDFDYAPTSLDAARAVAGTNSEAGVPGEVIRAAIPYGDDLIVFGCSNSMWVLEGDPAYSGRMVNRSQSVGIIDKFSWCRDDFGTLFFLSREGLYEMPGGNSTPRPLSREKLPQKLRDVNPVKYEVTLAYNGAERGVYIYITDRDGGDVDGWFYSIAEQAYFRDTWSNSQRVWIAHNYETDVEGYTGLMLGCNDGYIRTLSTKAANDDGTNIDSFVVYGPFRPTDDYAEGRMNEIIGVMSKGSSDVTASVLYGQTHEDVSKTGDTRGSFTWTEGLNKKNRPRTRGGSLAIKVANSDAKSWSVERVMAVFETLGKQRVR